MSEPLRILCFGNPLHGDDGFGPALAQALLAQTTPEHVTIIDAGTRGLDSWHLFCDCPRLLVVDVMAGSQAGRLHCYPAPHWPELVGSSAHGGDVGYLLRTVQTLVQPVPEMSLLVAEITTLTPFTLGLSPALQQAVSDACQLIQRQWFER